MAVGGPARGIRMRATMAAIVVALVSATVSLAPQPEAPDDSHGPSGTVVLKFFDAAGNGRLLSSAQARNVMDGAEG